MASLYAGALTNAPALAAAQEVLRDNHRDLLPAALQDLIDRPVIAFGLAYPFGVLGVMLSFQLYRTVFRIHPAPVAAAEPIEVRDFVVQNPGITGQKLANIFSLHKDLGFVISRIRHENETRLATAESTLATGDIVAVVGNRTAMERARHMFGEPSEVHIEHDRTALDYRRVFVSRPEVVGKRIGDLDLQSRLAATITR